MSSAEIFTQHDDEVGLLSSSLFVGGNYRIYTEYCDNLISYHICPIILISLSDYWLMNLKLVDEWQPHVEHDVMPHSAASDLGLQCLLRLTCSNT